MTFAQPRGGFAASASRGGSPRPGQAGSAAAARSARRLARGLVLGAGLLLVVCDALAQYKVIGPDGRVTYTDRPPSDAGHRVLPIRKGGGLAGDADGAAASTAGLPQVLRQPVARFPVTLVTGADCAPCDAARQALQRRGIPFRERSVASDDDHQALQRLAGGLTVPTLTVGSQVMRGWLEADWQNTLDLAGYPRESALPSTWRWAAATPLATRSAATEPAAAAPAPPPVPAAAAEPAPPASGPQIRF